MDMTNDREVRVILNDGSEVIMNTGDRVLFQASRPGAIPLTVDADFIVDDLILTLAEKDEAIENGRRNAQDWEDEYNKLQRRYLDLDKEAAESTDLFKEASKEVRRLRKALEEAVRIYETADMETDFANVLEGMYECLKAAMKVEVPL